MDKIKLRELLLQKRLALTNLEKYHFDQIINQKLLAFLITKTEIKTLALYKPIKNEVAFLDFFFDFLQTSKIETVFPCVTSNTEMEFRNKTDQLFTPTQIDCFLIPLVGFNSQGHRLGYGKGYYDRYLKKITNKQPKIGLAYSFQKSDFVSENWDEQLDCIVTNE